MGDLFTRSTNCDSLPASLRTSSRPQLENGKLVGYVGGLPRKKWLLDLEGAVFRDQIAA